MPAYLSPLGNAQQLDANGAPLNGGMIYTYAAGTVTPIATYTGSDGLTAQANPIILNSLGLPSSPIWLPAGQAVKFVIQNASGVTQRTVDNVSGVNDPSGVTAATEWTTYTGTVTYVSATSFSAQGDQTNVFQAGRRVKSTNTGGTAYSTISGSAYNSGTGLTTVTVVNTSGALDSGLSVASYGLLSSVNPSVPATVFPPPGQCRLAKNGAVLQLSPFQGNKLMINGVPQTIPSAGVTLAATGLSASTGYFIYAYMSGATMTLEASTTAYAIDTSTGVAIKGTDATRSLVGQAATAGAATWSSSALHCLSYFNRRRLTATGTYTAGRVCSSTYPTYSEPNTEIRVPLLAWSDTTVRADTSGYVSNAASSGLCYTNIGFDNTGATPEDGGGVFTSPGASLSGTPSSVANKTGLAELTLHYATLLAAASGGNSTYAGGANSYARTSLQVSLDG